MHLIQLKIQYHTKFKRMTSKFELTYISKLVVSSWDFLSLVPKKGNKLIPSSGDVKLSQLSSGKIILLSSQVTRAVLSMSSKKTKKIMKTIDKLIN